MDTGDQCQREVLCTSTERGVACADSCAARRRAVVLRPWCSTAHSATHLDGLALAAGQGQQRGATNAAAPPQVQALQQRAAQRCRQAKGAHVGARSQGRAVMAREGAKASHSCTFGVARCFTALRTQSPATHPSPPPPTHTPPPPPPPTHPPPPPPPPPPPTHPPSASTSPSSIPVPERSRERRCSQQPTSQPTPPSIGQSAKLRAGGRGGGCRWHWEPSSTRQQPARKKTTPASHIRSLPCPLAI